MGSVPQFRRLVRPATLGVIALVAAFPAMAEDGEADPATDLVTEPAVWAGLRPEARPEALVSDADLALAAALAQNAALPEAADFPAPSVLAAAPVLSETDLPEGVVEARVSRDPGIGPETGLPLPRFVSLKSSEGNVRRGPSLSHKIDWVYTRENMPLQITAEFGHWRRVQDHEGMGGWVHYSLLSGTRTVIVNEDLLPLRSRPQDGAPETALLEAGVIARLGDCEEGWCRLSVGGYRGWAPAAAVWGLLPGEGAD